MDEKPEAGSPKWIIIATAFLGLLAAVFTVVARYHDAQKSTDRCAMVVKFLER